MSAGSAEGWLDELQVGLEGLLSCLESAPLPGQAVLDGAWVRVQRSFDGLRSELDRTGPAPQARERVDHCLRLYAVAAGVLVRRREELAAERAACSDARARLRRLRRDGASGGSCDVRA